MKLSELAVGEHALIQSLQMSQQDRQRLQMLGVEAGQTLCFIGSPLWNDPMLFQLEDNLLALRRQDARHIIVEKVVL